jgi:hypothetical protein
MKNPMPLLALFALILAVALVAWAKQGVGYVYVDDMYAAGSRVAGALFVTALFLERSLAVVNGLVFPQERRLRIQTEDPGVTGAALLEAEQALAAVKADQDRLRLLLGFIAALFVSAAGARTLGALMTMPPKPPLPLHDELFHTVDIVLTAGVLAGGSSGIAAIIDIISKQMQVVSARLRAELRAARKA